MKDRSSIKSEIRKLFDSGKNEAEAYNVLSKSHSFCNISKKAINNWYKKFRSEERNLNDKRAVNSHNELTDIFLFDLIKENPEFSNRKLARLIGVSDATIRRRKIQLKNGDETANCRKKNNLKFTDEFIIELVEKNPLLDMAQLAKLANTSIGTISRRIKQINTNGERVKYVKKKYIPDGFVGASPKITDEYVINLVNENPMLNSYELAELANVSQTTMLNYIKKTNRNGKSANYTKKDNFKFTDDFLINLVEGNPNFTHEELSMYTNTSSTTIMRRLKQVNSNGEKVKYIDKKGIGNLKITDELLTELIDRNPGLSMAELAKPVGISPKTISRRLREINSNGEKIKYTDKKGGKPKITDEFLTDLVNQNPGLSMAELAQLADVSETTISRRLKKINRNGEKAKHVRKKPETYSKTKFNDEFLIDLINKNPELSMEELANLTGVSVTTISRRLKEINRDGEKVKYIVKKGGKSKFTDEFLINLISNNPDFSITELAKLARVSRNTISSRIKKLISANKD
jgi:DeoR/GlpR family transcriptional regulator of sugar metabolism